MPTFVTFNSILYWSRTSDFEEAMPLLFNSVEDKMKQHDDTIPVHPSSLYFRRSLVLASFASVVIAYCPCIEYAILVFILTASYVWLNYKIEKLYPDSIEFDEQPLFRFYVSIIHDVIAGLFILIILSSHLSFGRVIVPWLQSDWNTSFTAVHDDTVSSRNNVDLVFKALDVIAMCGTIAFEMKDAIVDDFHFGSIERVGIYIHHLSTIGACLHILNCRYGRGYMILNGLQCLVGSAIYCLWSIGHIHTFLYCIAMTVSNLFGLWLCQQYYILSKDYDYDDAFIFVLLVSFICFIRQYPVMEVIVHQILLLRPQQHQKTTMKSPSSMNATKKLK